MCVRAQKSSLQLNLYPGAPADTLADEPGGASSLQAKDDNKFTMKFASSLLFAGLGAAVIADGDAARIFAPSAVARPRGFLPGWGLPKHESALDRVSMWLAAVA